MQRIPPFKRGDEFKLYCVYKEEGDPSPIHAVIIKSQIRAGSRRTLVANMEVIKQEAVGAFVLTPTNPDTSGWPKGDVFMDIEFSSNATNKRSTETFMFTVVEDITRDD